MPDMWQNRKIKMHVFKRCPIESCTGEVADLIIETRQIDDHFDICSPKNSYITAQDFRCFKCLTCDHYWETTKE